MFICTSDYLSKIMPSVNVRMSIRDIELKPILDFREKYKLIRFRDNGKSYNDQCLEALIELDVMNKIMHEKGLDNSINDLYLNSMIIDKTSNNMLFMGKFNYEQIMDIRKLCKNFIVL